MAKPHSNRHLSVMCFVAVTLHFCALGQPTAGEVSIAVVGDYGVADREIRVEPNANARAVASMVASWDPDYIVTVGDNNYGNNALANASWENLLGELYGQFMLGRADSKYPLQSSPTQRFFPAVGNHDVQFVLEDRLYTRAGFVDYFHTDITDQPGRLPPGVIADEHVFYDVRLGEAHFFVMDSDQALRSADSRDQQMLWLNEALENSSAHWKFVSFHHPPYGSGFEGNIPQMRWPFGEWGADAVFSGHDHLYERIERDNTHYFVVGNGGQELYTFQDTWIEGSRFAYNDAHGAMLLTIAGGTAVMESYSIDDGLIDRIVLEKPIPEPSGLFPLLLVAVFYPAWARRTRRIAA